MMTALLILIAAILLLGAGVVKGWLRSIFGAVVAIVLLATLMLTITLLFGEDTFWSVWMGGGAAFIMAGLIAREYDPEGTMRETNHDSRTKSAMRSRKLR